MTVDVDWGTPQQDYILLTVGQSYSASALAQGVELVYALLNTVSHMVDVVVDLTAVDAVPGESLAFMPSVADRLEHPNLRDIYIVGANGYLSTLVDVFSSVFHELVPVETRQDALALMLEHETPY